MSVGARWSCWGEDFALGLAGFAAFLFGRFFVVAGAFYVACETFSHAKTLEPLEHLLHALVTAGANFNHS